MASVPLFQGTNAVIVSGLGAHPRLALVRFPYRRLTGMCGPQVVPQDGHGQHQDLQDADTSRLSARNFEGLVGRGSGIRTRDPLLPKRTIAVLQSPLDP